MATIRVGIFGSGGIGKTALVYKLTTGTFVDDIDPTIENTYKKELKVDGITYILDILDTAGPEEYHLMIPQYMKACHVVLILYSITDAASFENAKSLVDTARTTKEDSEYKCIAMGSTKCDLESSRAVAYEEVKAFADMNGFQHVETSAKESKNVEAVFEAAVRVSEVLLDYNQPGNEVPQEEEKCCCVTM